MPHLGRCTGILDVDASQVPASEACRAPKIDSCSLELLLLRHRCSVLVAIFCGTVLGRPAIAKEFLGINLGPTPSEFPTRSFRDDISAEISGMAGSLHPVMHTFLQAYASHRVLQNLALNVTDTAWLNLPTHGIACLLKSSDAAATTQAGLGC